jgi:acetyl esterase/lipase
MKIKSSKWILLLVFSIAIPCIAQTPQEASQPNAIKRSGIAEFRPPDDIEAIHDVEIGKGGSNILHAEILRPKNPPKSPTPALLLIHGGGWVGGAAYKKFLITGGVGIYGDRGRGSFANLGLLAARRGYFVASIEYRGRETAKWPAQIEDCKLAVRWLRANAGKYNVDPNRIGCWGHSAGGHLVACMGTMSDQKFEGNGGYEGVSSRPQLVVDLSGPTDFRSGNFTDGSDAIPENRKPALAHMIENLLGATFSEKPDLWADASPITHIRADDPPFIVVHGTLDPTISIAQATKFAAALRQAAVPVELIVVKNGKHGLLPAAGFPSTEPDNAILYSHIFELLDKYLKN